MELSSVKLSTRDVLVEQTDRRGVHPVERRVGVVWLLHLFERERIGLDYLVELVGCLWIHVLVVEPEPIVFEVTQDWDVRLKVDWGPLHHVSWLILVVTFSWSLLNWILPCLGIIVKELVFMLFHTIWDAVNLFNDCDAFASFRLSTSRGTELVVVDGVLIDCILLHLRQSFLLDSMIGVLDLPHG